MDDIKLRPQEIIIGYAGEYNARSIPLAFDDLKALVPDGVPVIFAKRPREDEWYPAANTTVEDGKLVWIFSAFDAAVSGIGYCHIAMVDPAGNVKATSNDMLTRVSGAQRQVDGAPDAYQSWVDALVSAGVSYAQTAVDAKRAAEEAAAAAALSAAAAASSESRAQQAVRDTTKAAANAQTYEQKASKHVTDASIARNAAQVASGNAVQYAGVAGQHATAAAASESAAETAKTAAETAQQAAESAQWAAETARNAAGVAAGEAAQSAQQAAQSAQDAANIAGSVETAVSAGVQAVQDQQTASVQAVTSQQTTSVAAVQQAGNAAAQQVEQVKATIPADYSALSGNVAQLKDDYAQLRSEIFMYDDTVGKANFSLLNGRYIGADTRLLNFRIAKGTQYDVIIEAPAGSLTASTIYEMDASGSRSAVKSNAALNTVYHLTASKDVEWITLYTTAKADVDATITATVRVVNDGTLEEKILDAVQKSDENYFLHYKLAADDLEMGGLDAEGLPNYHENRVRTKRGIKIAKGSTVKSRYNTHIYECDLYTGKVITQNDGWWGAGVKYTTENDCLMKVMFQTTTDHIPDIVTDFYTDYDASYLNPLKLPISCDIAMEESLPEYYRDYIAKKAKRIRDLSKSVLASGDIFAFITDQHWNLNAKNSPALLRYLHKECLIPKCFNGGDADGDTVSAYMAKLREAYDGKIYSVTGNHDYMGPTTEETLYYLLDRYNDNQIGNPARHYYYVDNPQQQIRYIFLSAFKADPSTTSKYSNGYEDAQYTWMTTEAMNVPDGWHMLFITHNMRFRDADTPNRFERAIDEYDGDGVVIGILQGHAHFDKVLHTAHGVPIMITTCDKYLPYIDPDTQQPEFDYTRRAVGTITEQAFDVVIIDKKQRNVYLVRIGCPAINDVDGVIGSDLEERVVTY